MGLQTELCRKGFIQPPLLGGVDVGSVSSPYLKIYKKESRKSLSLKYEELNSLLWECENVVNSRLLTYVSYDNELEPLTPSMFLRDLKECDRWIPRGVSFQRPRHRIIAVASLGRLSRNRSIPVWFTRYPRTALSDRWRSLGITSLMNIGGIRYVHIHSYIGHHDQACVLACKMQCISKFHEIKLKS
ncbi:hypothetical protein TNCV_913031 [Trichonephila clavipes]|nr:hypothetical protein TNCV_913031 [Trichonephila clavipes]